MEGMAARWTRRVVLLRGSGFGHAVRPFTCSPVQGSIGPAAKDVNEVADMLAEPSWSVKTLFTKASQSSSQPHVSQKQLHHLLRLSALPLPANEAEEAKMLRDLESQLQFVRAIQQVNTDGVESLVSIRDETKQAEKELEITLETLGEDLKKERVSGIRGRITRDSKATKEEAENWDALACAPKTVGRYIALDKAGNIN